MSFYEDIYALIGEYDSELHPYRRVRPWFMDDEKFKELTRREQLILRLEFIYGKGHYDYSRIPAIKTRKAPTYIEIGCSVHGFYERKLNNALRGTCSCSDCMEEQKAERRKASISFYENLHDNKFDYSLVDFTKPTKHKVTIICRVCDTKFEQNLGNHRTNGCPECAKIRPLTVTTEDFVTRATAVHGDRYSYENTTYKGRHTKLTITCRSHGDFMIQAGNHLTGQGCWHCRNEAISFAAKNTHHLNESNENDACTFYFIELKIEDRLFVKLGITRGSIRKRFGAKRNTVKNVIYQQQTTYKEAIAFEESLLDRLSEHRYRIGSEYRIDGWTECFPYELKETISNKLTLLLEEESSSV